MTRGRVGLSTIAVVIVILMGATQAGAEVSRIDDFAPRWSPATAVIGKRLFIFGGVAPYTTRGRPKELLFDDGAIVDPRTGDSDVIAEAPFDPPLGSPRAAVVNKKVFVVGTSCNASEDDEGIVCHPDTPAAGLYDIDDDSWKTVKMPKALRPVKNLFAEPLGVTSDGRVVMVVQTGTTFLSGLPHEYWTYSVRGDRWTRLPAAGFRAESECLLGDELVVLRVKYEQRGIVRDEDPVPNGGGSGDYYVQPSLAVLDLGKDSWRETALEPTARYEGSTPTISCLDGQVMLVGSVYWNRDLRLYDEASNRWSVPVQAPASSIFSLNRVWTGTELIVLASEVDIGKPSVAYNPATNSWRELQGMPPITRSALWNGKAIVGYQEPLNVGSGPPKTGVYHYMPGTTDQ